MSADRPAGPEVDVPGYRVGSASRASRHGRSVTGVRRSDGTAVDIELVTLHEGDAERFLVEASTLLDLPASPYLLPVLDVGTTTDDGATVGYVVTPRAERTLGDRRSAQGPLPAEALREVALDAALGLCALHGADLVHGGLSPTALVELANGRSAVTGASLPLLAEADDGPYRPPEVRARRRLVGGRGPVGAGHRAARARRLGAAARAADVVDRPAHRRGPAGRPDDASRVVDELRALRAPDPLETASPAAPVPTVRSGRPLGSGYLLDEPIGRGATGQVWRGRRRATAPRSPSRCCAPSWPRTPRWSPASSPSAPR